MPQDKGMPRIQYSRMVVALPTIIKHRCMISGKDEEFRLVDFKLGMCIYQCVLHGYRIMISPEEARAKVGL